MKDYATETKREGIVLAKKMGLVKKMGKWHRKNGKAIEEMIMFDPIFGWLSQSDLFDLRQSDPRMAP